MRRHRIVTAALGAALALGPAAGLGAEELRWRTLRSEPGRFSIDLPAAPSPSDESQPSDAGHVPGTAWSTEAGGVVLRIEHYDLPRLAVLFLGDRRVIAMAADRMLADRKGRETEREPYTLGGRPGLRVRYLRDDLGGTIAEEARFVLAGRRLYVAYAREAPPAPPEAPARIAHFFDSLEVWEAR